jgi:hypothetical protein
MTISPGPWSAAHLIRLQLSLTDPSATTRPAPAELGIRAGGRRSCPGVVLTVLDHALRDPSPGRPHPTRGAVVRKISAHLHHEHQKMEIIEAFALVRTVELRGLEPLTL